MPAAQIPFSGQQQFDQYNRVVPYACIYLYLGNTTTPISGYANRDLTVSHTWPIEANGAGRFPNVWIDDTPETARVVITDASGALLYEDPEMPVIGPSRWTTVTPDVDVTRLIPTGVGFFVPIEGSLPNFVRMNQRTIGNAVSGASERASADCEALFTFLWERTNLAVSGGRGSTSAEDWSANKTIETPNMRGRGPLGLDTMGNSAAGTAPGVTSANSYGGAASKTLAISEIPSHNHGGLVGAGGSHTHTAIQAHLTASLSGTVGGALLWDGVSSNVSTAPDHQHVIPAQGGGAAFSLLNPYCAGTWYIKL